MCVFVLNLKKIKRHFFKFWKAWRGGHSLLVLGSSHGYNWWKLSGPQVEPMVLTFLDGEATYSSSIFNRWMRLHCGNTLVTVGRRGKITDSKDENMKAMWGRPWKSAMEVGHWTNLSFSQKFIGWPWGRPCKSISRLCFILIFESYGMRAWAGLVFDSRFWFANGVEYFR